MFQGFQDRMISGKRDQGGSKNESQHEGQGPNRQTDRQQKGQYKHKH